MRANLKVAGAIKDARLTTRLTQDQLGRRVGLKGRGISRWELGHSLPSKRHRDALVTAIAALNQQAAGTLAEAFASLDKPSASAEAAPAAAPAPIDPRRELELAVFVMADELDLPPRRIRGSLRRLLHRLRTAGTTVDAAERELALWIQNAAG